MYLWPLAVHFSSDLFAVLEGRGVDLQNADDSVMFFFVFCVRPVSAWTLAGAGFPVEV